MILTELALSNFKAHRNKVVNFQLGLNGIIGDNGAGKTCLLDAIEFLFTGDLSCKKEDAITRGQGDGYVRGKFLLNGKEGSIERHLGSSKVVLEYDDKKLHKAGDVKELWASLLQIDSHIFHNVIVAKQNEIRFLFTGDTQVREKVFQKIFMVPNTDKIRNIVYGYIKDAPPQLPEEDVAEIEATIANVVKNKVPVSTRFTELKTATLKETDLLNIVARINFINKCIEDTRIRPLYTTEHETTSQSIATQAKLVKQVEEAMTGVDYVHYKNLYEQLLASQSLWKIKLNLSQQFDNLNQLTLVGEDKLKQWKAEAITLQASIAELSAQFAVNKSTITNLESDVATLRKLTGCASCPTCKQELVDVGTFINKQQAEANKHKDNQQKVVDQLGQLRAKTQTIDKNITDTDEATKKLNAVLTELSKYNNVRFRQENFEITKTIVNDFENKQQQLNEARTRMAELQGNLELLNNKLKNLNNYDDIESTPQAELALLKNVVDQNIVRNKELTEIQVKLGQMETEVRMLNDRVTLSKESRAKNAKIGAYVKTLTDLYEMLHVTQFPRQLIETYSDVVEEELVQYVQKFNIKYRPRIANGFAIEMIDENGHVMPEVSGAQQNIVGLSLRLALHGLFSQNFPILIIDEGTTNMDEGNRAKYFEAIAGLKSDGVVRQIIVIDHDPMLADVVDNVIKL